MKTMELVTAEELYELPSNGSRVELVKGEIVEMPPTGLEHGDIEGNVYFQVKPFVAANHLGLVVVGEVGFVLSRDPDTVRAADVAFISKARLPSGDTSRYYEGAPDLAVEIVSPNDRHPEIHAKVLDWLEAGTQQVWVMDPKTRTVTVYSPDRKAVILTEEEELGGGKVLPDFSCRVGAFFEDVP